MRKIHGILCDSVATSFLNIATRVYDQLLYLPPWQSSNGGIFQAHAIYPMSLSMLVYLNSMLVTFFLANVIGVSMVLSGVVWCYIPWAWCSMSSL